MVIFPAQHLNFEVISEFFYLLFFNLDFSFSFYYVNKKLT